MKKNKKNNSFVPIWVWVLIIIFLFQIGKLAYRNDWFKADNNSKKEMSEEDKERMKEIIDKMIKEKNLKKN